MEAWSPLGRVAEALVDSNGEYSLSIPVNTSTAGQPVTFTMDGSMVGGSMADSTVTLTSGADDSVDLNVDGCGRALPRPRATVTVSDILVSTCPSVSRPGSYAKYYYFVLDRSAEITIDMDSEVGAFGFDDYFYLKDSTGRYSTLGRNRDSGSLTAELPAGVYVIEATAFHTLTTGRYTLTVSGLPRVGDTPAPPLTAPPHGVSGLAEVLGIPAVQGTLVEAWSPLGRVAEALVDSNGEYSLSIPVNTSTAGQPVTFTMDGSMVGGSMADSSVILTSGADETVDLYADGCGRALPRQSTTVTVPDTLHSGCPSVSRPGSYAKYYYFVLDRSAEITIDMDSEVGAFGFDDYFYLKDSTGRYSTLGRNRDSGSLTAELPAGVYVIEATAFHTLTTGRYTLTVSGLPIPTPLGAPAITTPITAGAGSLIVSWRAPSGDGSGITAYDLRHIPAGDDETVDANWTVMYYVWTVSGPLRFTLTGLEDGVQYGVQVRAVNALGPGPWSATATGTTETRSNNHPPVFTAVRSIPEDATAGYPVGAPFTAADPDGDPLSYALSGADSGSFAIGRTTGQITLAAGVVLDYETKASYAVTVTATDGGGLWASIDVTINVTKEDEADPPAGPCVQSIDLNGEVVSGAWTGDCPSDNLPGSNARYYTFTLETESEVAITLESSDADTFLILLSGAGPEGIVLHSNLSRIQETLGAGDYTIEATTLDAGATGSFTLSVALVEEGEPPEPEPSDPCVETVEEDGTVSGEWGSGCQSANRLGSYARYYTFTLGDSREVAITLESSDADTFLNLLSGAGRDGGVLHYNDDHEGSTSQSLIRETLDAGSYTVEATTYDAGETGGFTLTIQGL